MDCAVQLVSGQTVGTLFDMEESKYMQERMELEADAERQRQSMSLLALALPCSEDAECALVYRAPHLDLPTALILPCPALTQFPLTVLLPCPARLALSCLALTCFTPLPGLA